MSEVCGFALADPKGCEGPMYRVGAIMHCDHDDSDGIYCLAHTTLIFIGEFSCTLCHAPILPTEPVRL